MTQRNAIMTQGAELRHGVMMTCVSCWMSSAVMVWLLVMLTGPVPVSPMADNMEQCPPSLYDCTTLETSLTKVADVILMPDFVSSLQNNYAQVKEVCDFLKSPSCSDTVLTECKGEVVYASDAVKARMQYVCGNRNTWKDMEELKACYLKYKRHFNYCAKKHRKHRDDLEWSPPAGVTHQSWCNLTQEYITCVYSVMALGCALDVANHYMHTVNMSAPVVQAIRGYGCSFGHPLDILRTTSPISVVTSAPVRGPDPSADRPSLRARSSSLRAGAVVTAAGAVLSFFGVGVATMFGFGFGSLRGLVGLRRWSVVLVVVLVVSSSSLLSLSSSSSMLDCVGGGEQLRSSCVIAGCQSALEPS
ncbi:uncharacterized protein LOC143301380 [Babylonia areolata]|uniref:uncharacterized protein LOC143301380 n=1 Tax=Babylonia areolata TaxID=304850 RepID=UPI003FD11147